MSRTYKYSIESIEDTDAVNDFAVFLRIQKRLERQKHRKKKRIQTNRSFKKFISFRDKQRSRVYS